MATVSVHVEYRVRGLWALRVAQGLAYLPPYAVVAWLLRWLLARIVVEYRVRGGRWRRVPVALTLGEEAADGPGAARDPAR